jgi:hypothetical protein
MIIPIEILKWDAKSLTVRGRMYPDPEKIGVFTIRREGGWTEKDIRNYRDYFHLK